ncbi:hypothetical protein AVEN_197194-1 [Araneus ventricosus]|uniref:Uncharacterized protein n=1 Tax=Araneus ventricosus TaxID=182803 RepID=A0A4Y2N8J2_ARAVE|nr:hypothetical protein AVEN_197194-1 [Araneus ventricosus]
MADYLSRATYKKESKSQDQITIELHAIEAKYLAFNIEAMSIQDLIKNQEEDSYCQNIKDKLKSGFVFAQKSPVFFIRDDLLLCYRNSGPFETYLGTIIFRKPRTTSYEPFETSLRTRVFSGHPMAP